jgi:hypothetical protein
MQDAKLRALGEAIEAASAVEGALAARAAEALAAAGVPVPDGFGGVDAVLAVVDRALPGWSITLEGTASAGNGHWTCTLRRSRERDNDEVIGIGRGAHLAPALLGALVKVVAFGPRP